VAHAIILIMLRGKKATRTALFLLKQSSAAKFEKTQQNFDRILLYSAPFKGSSIVFRSINQNSVQMLRVSLISKQNITDIKETAIRSTSIIQAIFLRRSLI